MNYLTGKEKKDAFNYIDVAVVAALNSTCFRLRCGSVIVKNNEIIGEGYNSPPKNIKPERCVKDNLPESFKSDKTCCIHAEQRAIFDALKNNKEKIADSRLYFIRIDSDGNKLFSGKPYCTICSKMALDVGISEFVLYQEDGICVYDTKEYNGMSFEQV